MEKGWVMIDSGSAHEMELKCAVLREHDIHAIVINKQDSSYLFGSAELYVKQDDVIRSKHLLHEKNA